MQIKKSCLLIHGFGGSREEVSPLAQHLTEQGYRVICPSLKGHTGKRRDLKNISYVDWILSAEQELQELITTSEQIYVVGFSMGGLIALNLASKYHVDGVVTLNTPIYYWDVKRIALNLLEDIKKKKLENTRRYLQSSSKFPMSAMLNFRLILSKTKSLIGEVHSPVFIAQALEDDTVRKSSATYIYRNIGSQNKTVKFYPDSGHLILWSCCSSQVIQDVTDFIKE